MKRIVVFVLLGFLLQSVIASGGKENKTIGFIQPGFAIGEALPSNSNWPQTKLETNFTLSLGRIQVNPAKDWAVFLNYPTTGIMFSFTNIGNNEVFGSAYSIVPYIAFNTTKKQFNAVHVKVGLGASYFTNHFDANENKYDLAIGSTLTWAFHTSVYYNFYINKHVDLNLGLVFAHYSNGHTQLPNLGLNSLLLSVSSKLFFAPVDKSYTEKFQKPPLKYNKQHFLNFRIGFGLHEFGGPVTETGGIKRAVNIFSIGVGTIYKQALKVRVGLSYRFYQQYYNYIVDYKPEPYVDKPVLNSSNILVYMGGELLLGHVGVDGEIGINIFKPFYAEHHKLYEVDPEIIYWLKETFSTRVGLKYYLINTARHPENNIFIGAYIDANFGQADFSEASIGFVHRFKGSDVNRN